MTDTSYLSRMMNDFTVGEPAWFERRLYNISASDVAALSRESSIKGILDRKFSSNFFGNKYTNYGNDREPEIAEWIENNLGVSPNGFLFHAENQERHLATPDGVSLLDGVLVTSEIKTTNKPLKSIPLKYLRQIYWQQYVLGAERTLFVWEEHENFVPLSSGPEYRWVERNDDAIKDLRRLADLVLFEIDKRTEQPVQEGDPLPF